MANADVESRVAVSRGNVKSAARNLLLLKHLATAPRRETLSQVRNDFDIDRQENIISVVCFAMPNAGSASVEGAISGSVPLARLGPSRGRRIVRLLKECIGRSEPADGALRGAVSI